MNNRLVLVIEAEPDLQRRMANLVRDWNYRPVLTSSVDEAIGAVAHNQFSFSLLDADLPASDGLDFLRQLRVVGGEPGPVILLIDTDDSHRTAEGISLGVADIIPKPLDPDELEGAINRTVARLERLGDLKGDTAVRLRREIALWRSPKMQAVLDMIRQAAEVDVTVLICGETGTGKELVARAVHELSPRQGKPFIKVNCAAVPLELLESELFGHERGAFTGAHQLKLGKFELAHHGTIFLDEIGDLHPALQAKLLHVLQDGAFSRVGGKATIRVDVRVIAATNRDLERAVLEERFRDDLYYRLNVIQITVPPLRERPEEIPVLAEYFVQRYATQFHREGFALAPSAMERLTRHRYPGNVRELENVIKRMLVLDDPFLAKTSFPSAWDGNDGASTGDRTERPAVSLKDIARMAARAAEREAIARVLAETGWNRVKAAKLLNISYRALLYKMKDVGLEQKRSASGSG